jgi:hypothetical protein
MRDAQLGALAAQRDAQRAAAAERMRRARTRRKRAIVSYRSRSQTLRSKSLLYKLGLLPVEERDDRRAIGRALARLHDRIPPRGWRGLLAV